MQRHCYYKRLNFILFVCFVEWNSIESCCKTFIELCDSGAPDHPLIGYRVSVFKLLFVFEKQKTCKAYDEISSAGLVLVCLLIQIFQFAERINLYCTQAFYDLYPWPQQSPLAYILHHAWQELHWLPIL